MIHIRKYQDGDEIELRKIFFNTIRNINIKDYSENQVKAWAPDTFDESVWSVRIKSINPFIAQIKNDVVGYADVQDDGYIDHFFCHSDYQGQGVGKALMQALFVEGKRKEIDRFYSHVSITAKSFFEYFGFQVVKKQEVTVRDQMLTNYVMEKIE